jgi:Tfp pilus assembly protein PilN
MMITLLLTLAVILLAVGVYALHRLRAEQRDAHHALTLALNTWSFEVTRHLEDLVDLETQKQAQRAAKPGLEQLRERLRARAAQAKA